MWQDDNQVEQIKFNVDPHTKVLISRCDTMAEVWEVINVKFVQEQENSDLKIAPLLSTL